MHWHPANVTSSCARRGGQRQPSSAGSAQARSSSPSRHPRLPMRRTASPTTCSLWRASRLDPAAGRGKPGCRWPRWYPGTGRPQPGGRHGPGESSSENGHGRGDHHGRRGPAQQAGGHPAEDPVHGGRRRGVEGPGMPGGQGQSAAVPEGGGGSLYHPQVDQAIRKKEELHKALREHREPIPEETSATAQGVGHGGDAGQ